MYKIRTAVIGVGSMGQNHARIYNELSDLRYVIDSNYEQAKSIGNRLSKNYVFRSAHTLHTIWRQYYFNITYLNLYFSIKGKQPGHSFFAILSGTTIGQPIPYRCIQRRFQRDNKLYPHSVLLIVS